MIKYNFLFHHLHLKSQQMFLSSYNLFGHIFNTYQLHYLRFVDFYFFSCMKAHHIRYG